MAATMRRSGQAQCCLDVIWGAVNGQCDQYRGSPSYSTYGRARTPGKLPRSAHLPARPPSRYSARSRPPYQRPSGPTYLPLARQCLVISTNPNPDSSKPGSASAVAAAEGPRRTSPSAARSRRSAPTISRTHLYAHAALRCPPARRPAALPAVQAGHPHNASASRTRRRAIPAARPTAGKATRQARHNGSPAAAARPEPALILKNQPSSPNCLDLIVAVHHVRPCKPTTADAGQCRPEPLTIN